ncbi:hypothetical protein PBOI14_41920 [Pseudomonas sp. Boi14]|nr:hypothetical protein PBOI14_41920 [Pseudomonas sp. Boi14]
MVSLKEQLLAQTLPPEQLVSIVARNMRSLADLRASSGEEERYSHSDLNGFAANLETTRKVIDLLRPLLAKSAAQLLPQVDSAADALATRLASLRDGFGYVAYDQVDARQRKEIADKAKALADALDAIDPALGLSGL